jgi:hypothetical protein
MGTTTENIPELVRSARWITENHQARSIDVLTHKLLDGDANDPAVIVENNENCRETPRNATILDAFTASMIVQVWDKINEDNRERWRTKMTNVPVMSVVSVLWKAVK